MNVWNTIPKSLRGLMHRSLYNHLADHDELGKGNWIPILPQVVCDMSIVPHSKLQYGDGLHAAILFPLLHFSSSTPFVTVLFLLSPPLCHRFATAVTTVPENPSERSHVQGKSSPLLRINIYSCASRQGVSIYCSTRVMNRQKLIEGGLRTGFYSAMLIVLVSNISLLVVSLYLTILHPG